MNANTLTARLAVCSWSLQPVSPQDLITKLGATGVRRVQLALDPLRDSPGVWGETDQLLREAGFQVVSGMMGCVGEDYSTLESIRITGGIAPDGTWEANLKNSHATALLAAKLGLKLVTMHAGFVPHDEADPGFGKMVLRLRAVADAYSAQGIMLGLETGQETAPSLLRFLQLLDRPNLGVNFDPANMILYDKGDPIEAVRVLSSWIRQVHIKDAVRTRVAGTWGEEVPAGEGQVDWPAFFGALGQAGYRGDLVIEREAGNQRAADIVRAREMIQRLTRA
jgi:hydroxypyruvate isomerase